MIKMKYPPDRSEGCGDSHHPTSRRRSVSPLSLSQEGGGKRKRGREGVEARRKERREGEEYRGNRDEKQRRKERDKKRRTGDKSLTIYYYFKRGSDRSALVLASTSPEFYVEY